MKHGTIKKVQPTRHVTREDLQLSQKEVEIFVHNAQLSLCEYAPDEILPVLCEYKIQLLQLLRLNSLFCPNDLALVLVSAAYDLITQSTHPNSPLNENEGWEDEDSPMGHRNLPDDRNIVEAA